MSHLFFDEDMTQLSDVTRRLKLFAEIAYQTTELTLSGEYLSCFISSLTDDLDRVVAVVEQRRQASSKNSVSPARLAQIISTACGMRSIMGKQLNEITCLLRECAADDEDMEPVSTIWEDFLMSSGSVNPITSLEGFLIEFDTVRAKAVNFTDK